MTDPTPDSLHLSWTVPEGQFDSFMVQYRDRAGRPQVVPVEGPERSVIISPLDPDHKYRFTLFGIANKKRHGPLTADGTTGEWQPPKPPALQGADPSQPSTCLPSARSWLGPPSEMADSESWPRFWAQGQPASPALLGPFHPVQLLPEAQKVCHTLAVPGFSEFGAHANRVETPTGVTSLPNPRPQSWSSASSALPGPSYLQPQRRKRSPATQSPQSGPCWGS